MTVKLPSFFKLYSVKDLIRLGKHNDGGYLVTRSSVLKSTVLVSLGINDDWSFERDFIKKNNLRLNAYDASIDKFVFFKRFIKSLFWFYKPRLFLKNAVVFFDFILFFRHKRRHIKKFVGLNSDSELYCSLESILEQFQEETIFLKIDVEGFEYRFLETIIKYQDKVCGLAIEFHDCDLHILKIKNFIEHLRLDLVHVHANNYAPINLDNGLPLVLELTFSEGPSLETIIALPHPLDMPNNPAKKEITLTF